MKFHLRFSPGACSRNYSALRLSGHCSSGRSARAFFQMLFSRTLFSALVVVTTASQISFSHGTEEDESLLRLHKRLIEAESTSQHLEKNAADVLVKYFEEISWSVQVLPTFGNTERTNVFAWPGKTNHTKLLVTSHIDTVPPYIPYSIHDGSIWGRGSADAKASVATQIEAVRRLIKKNMIDPDDVALLYVVGEETAGVSPPFPSLRY